MELVTTVLLRALEKPGPWQEGVLQAETSSRSRTSNTFMFPPPSGRLNAACGQGNKTAWAGYGQGE